MSDKLLLKAAGIIGIILGIFSCLLIIGLLWGIPMIIGGYQLYDISNMSDEEILDHKSAILGWSIFFLIFGFIAGVLSLIYFFGITNAFELNHDSQDIKTLKELKKLYEEKSITKEEYEAKKKEILDRI